MMNIVTPDAELTDKERCIYGDTWTEKQLYNMKHCPDNKRPGEVNSTLDTRFRRHESGKVEISLTEYTTPHGSKRTMSRSISLSLTPEQAQELAAFFAPAPAFSVPWDDAPEWAQWAAMDRYGEWYWYEVKPELQDITWSPVCDQDDVFRQFSFAPFPGNWEDSLQERPK